MRLLPDTRVAPNVQVASPAAADHSPPEIRTFTTRSPLPPESEAIPVTGIDELFTLAPSGGDVIPTVGGALSSRGACMRGYRSTASTGIGYGAAPVPSGALQASCPGP